MGDQTTNNSAWWRHNRGLLRN